MMSRIVKYGVVAVLALFVFVQFIPVDRNNPPVQGAIRAPNEVITILRKACYDCHSNETRWPWYSRIAPFSWLVAEHVHEGRKHLNFSTWDQYNRKNKDHKMEDLIDVIKEGEMPLASYLLLHPDARLSPQETKRLIQWANDMRRNLRGTNTGPSDDHDDERDEEEDT